LHDLTAFDVSPVEYDSLSNMTQLHFASNRIAAIKLIISVIFI